MQRRDFLKSTMAVAVAAELGLGKAQAKVLVENEGTATANRSGRCSLDRVIHANGYPAI